MKLFITQWIILWWYTYHQFIFTRSFSTLFINTTCKATIHIRTHIFIFFRLNITIIVIIIISQSRFSFFIRLSCFYIIHIYFYLWYSRSNSKHFEDIACKFTIPWFQCSFKKIKIITFHMITIVFTLPKWILISEVTQNYFISFVQFLMQLSFLWFSCWCCFPCIS